MMGRTHAISGTTAWAIATAAAPELGFHPRPAVIATGLLTAAGAALLPDLDHPEATIARTFGSLSHAAATFVERVSGGHRHATHSAAFIGACYAAVWLGTTTLGILFAVPLLLVLFAFALRALGIRRSNVLLLAVACTLAAVLAVAPSPSRIVHSDYGWLPTAVALGAAMHLIGDCLTPEGCPLLWPRATRYRFPLIPRTGGRIERWVFVPGLAAVTVALLVIAR